jgi:hypothetical protein
MTDEQIYYAILGDVKIGRKMHSPLPPRDDNPSFWLFRAGDRILWHDARRTEKYDRSARGLLREIAGKDGYKLVKSKNLPNISLREDPAPKRSLVTKDFNSWELRFWDNLGVDHRCLLRNKCYVVEDYSVNDRKLFSSGKSRVYAYILGKDRYQLYRPDEDRVVRFRSINISNTLFGYDLLDGGGDLIITSSNKDRIVLSSLGYKACAPSSETVNSIIYNNYADMRLRYRNIYLLYDNDKTGLEKMEALSRELSVIPIILPATIGKDPADIAKISRDYLKDLLFRWIFI